MQRITYYILWSNKDGNYWFTTDEIKKLQDPLAQIYSLHRSKTNKTSLPIVFKGTKQNLVAIEKQVDDRIEYSFEISEPSK